ncbi:hypothetical protein [Polynucleobacter difficilis]|nr:hypothetical protein [Polynucleobacter difficilis]
MQKWKNTIIPLEPFQGAGRSFRTPFKANARDPQMDAQNGTKLTP